MKSFLAALPELFSPVWVGTCSGCATAGSDACCAAAACNRRSAAALAASASSGLASTADRALEVGRSSDFPASPAPLRCI